MSKERTVATLSLRVEEEGTDFVAVEQSTLLLFHSFLAVCCLEVFCVRLGILCLRLQSIIWPIYSKAYSVSHDYTKHWKTFLCLFKMLRSSIPFFSCWWWWWCVCLSLCRSLCLVLMCIHFMWVHVWVCTCMMHIYISEGNFRCLSSGVFHFVFRQRLISLDFAT